MTEDPSVPSNTQLAAVICLKQAVLRQWRVNPSSGKSKSVSLEDRAQLKQKLLLQIQKPISKILHVNHISVMLGHIFRLEWPKSFEELLDTLLACLNQNDMQLQVQTLYFSSLFILFLALFLML